MKPKHTIDCPNAGIDYLPDGATTCPSCDCDMTAVRRRIDARRERQYREAEYRGERMAEIIASDFEG